MIATELAALAIVIVFVVGRARRDPEPIRFLSRMVLLVAASWLAENSAIHAYGFYRYSPDWSLFIDRVPVMIVIIWPVVIHSAWDLARYLLGPDHRHLPVAAAAIVFADAWLIEPIAVQSGLWSWSEPGLFAVPPVGVLGWSYFAGASVAVLRRAQRTARPGWSSLPILVAAPVATHALLLATWWSALRWVNVTIAAWPAVAVVWTVAVALTVAALGRRLRDRVPLIEMVARVPAAAFFFVLLLLDGAQVTSLVVYALAFVPPYLALTGPNRG